MKKDDFKNIIKKATDATLSAADNLGKEMTSLADKAQNVAESTAQKIKEKNCEKKALEEKERADAYDEAIKLLRSSEAETVIRALGSSPVELSPSKLSQIHSCFPIPREQFVFWADAEFDLRPSGIVVTSSGVFIKTNVGVFESSFKTGKRKVSDSKTEKNTSVSNLFFYNWCDFDPSWFMSDSPEENTALLVEPQCSQRFISVCRSMSKEISERDRTTPELEPDIPSEEMVKPALISAATVESAQSAVFVEQKAAINTPAGHGEMAEEAINMLDRLHGLDAKVVGRNNAKDGADRMIGNDIFIQTKYYNSARGSLEACFNPETGNYRYMHEGKPMQLEVPKDQYQRVLEGFKQKIKAGKVPGVVDPAEAEQIVRKGRLTYKQAVNLTKPGTIESLQYDAITGAVVCSCAFGITFVATVFLSYRKTGDLKEAVQAGMAAGLQVFGLSFIQHMLVSQIARISLAKSLIGPSQFVVGKIGTQASASIVNGIRALSGKSAIYGTAATKHLAKILRSNVVTSALTFVVFSVPETYKLSTRKISGAQFAKNMSVLAGSIVAGAGGAVGAGVAAAKVGALAGTGVAPGVGTVVGIAGGFVGGVIGAKTVGVVGDILHENDIEKYSRLFNAYISVLSNEFLLDESEVDSLVANLDTIKPKEFKKLFEDISKATEQELVIREFLEPRFNSITNARAQFEMPSNEDFSGAIDNLLTL